ncbi:hypothetical protein FRC01_000075 [Tulasnella sp. 417]|nr:hypothetical protein FRC01_000075 [Tulasnella sp. 417]
MESPIPPIDVAKAAFNMLVTRANQGDTALPDDSSWSIITLDSHIHAIEAMMAFLVTEANDYLLPFKQSRNTLAPIHVLPDEVLINIWLHCVEDASCDGSQVDDQLNTLALVCKSWQWGVLDHSVLWCYLQDSCKSERYNEWVLRKSQNHPLHLRLSAENPYVSGCLLKIAMPECRRWKSFVLAPTYGGGSQTWGPQLDILVDANLESLTRFEVQPRICWSHPDPISLPATPSLREIKLVQFPLHWETFNAPQLRALRISSLAMDVLYFLQLADLLRSTPFLEVLLLREFSMSTPDALPHQNSPVLLPRLRALDIYETPCKDLLYLIRTESLEQLRCDPASLDLWKPPLCPILNDVKSAGTVELVYRDNIRIATDPHPFYQIEWPYHEGDLTTEGFAFTTDAGPGMRNFLDITQWVGSLGLHTIVDLDLDNPHRTSVDVREIPVELLDHLPNVRTLVIGEGVNVDALFTQLGRP